MKPTRVFQRGRATAIFGMGQRSHAGLPHLSILRSADNRSHGTKNETDDAAGIATLLDVACAAWVFLEI